MPCMFSSSEDFADFIARYDTTPDAFRQMAGTDCIDFINDQFAVVHLPLDQSKVLLDSTYTYSAIPKLFSLLDLSGMETSGILQTLETPSFSSKGRGVLIGIIDTGIDYQNPIFQWSNGTTKILGLWDQTHGNGNSAPELSFQTTYGTLYTKSQIDTALASDDPLSIVPSTDENGHGTALSSIAVGNPDETNGFTGAAPESYLGIVKLKPAKSYLRDFFLIRDQADAYQENDIMMGVTYLFSLARRYNTPLVVLIGLGTNSGNHTGTSSLEIFLDQMSRYNGTAFVVAAGNETGYDHHYRQTTGPERKDTQVEINVGEPTKGFSMEFWAQDIGIYSIGFVSPSGQVIAPRSIRTDRPETYRFLIEGTRITV